MNEHLIDIYFIELKKNLNHGIRLLAKIRHFTPKHLKKSLYLSLFHYLTRIYMVARMVARIYEQDQNEEFQRQ